ncbi:MAG: TlpA family protein disulfide reductase [Mediterranea sp.]|jgi:thiol-disulfide isomerase/thioredoxin|nr:TlpA family protein disulfide reductase [Mediterranea sp.]
MKNTILSLLLTLLGTSGCSRNISVINGAWEREKPDSIQLYSVAGGTLHKVASSQVGENGAFSFTFEPQQDGYYIIGLSPSTVTNRYIFYFKPGDKLNVRVSENSYELTGENTPENKEMARWHDFIFPLEDKAVYFKGKNSTFEDFFPLFEEKFNELNNYPPVNTSNSSFNSSFRDFMKNDLLCIALVFIQTPRSKHPERNDFIGYYENIYLPELTKNLSLLNYPGGLNLLLQSYMIAVKLNSDLSNEQKKERYDDPASYLLGGADSDLISNDTIKGELAVMLAGNNRSLTSFSGYAGKYGKYVVTASQKERWKSIEASLNKNEERKEAIDLKFPDATGKEFALSGFKGKVVYIDIWATWCGPCKREFPFLKKLEAEYHGNKDMIFLGLNVDLSKDKQKWLDFLEKETLPGIQLFAGDSANKAIMKPYNIKGIPRFMLVGKDGKLIFTDAPRPSSNEIRAVINNALKE